MILYEGPSELDGAPIVVIATGMDKASRNIKTGAMVQTWILRADIPPLSAAKTGADASICGDCMHRPANVGDCYVNLGQAVTNIWKRYKAGGCPPSHWSRRVGLFRGFKVRLGAYGDPAAVPWWVWRDALLGARGVTGYTHQWRTAPAEFQQWCMASTDSEAEAREAIAEGWRTFRVRGPADPLMLGEVICPASAEAGHKTTCAECMACGGALAKARAPIAIIAHGAKARRFALYREGKPA